MIPKSDLWESPAGPCKNKHLEALPKVSKSLEWAETKESISLKLPKQFWGSARLGYSLIFHMRCQWLGRAGGGTKIQPPSAHSRTAPQTCPSPQTCCLSWNLTASTLSPDHFPFINEMLPNLQTQEASYSTERTGPNLSPVLYQKGLQTSHCTRPLCSCVLSLSRA